MEGETDQSAAVVEAVAVGAQSGTLHSQSQLAGAGNHYEVLTCIVHT